MKPFRSVAMLSLSCASLLASLACTEAASTESPTVQQQRGPAEKVKQPGEKDFEEFDRNRFSQSTSTKIDNPWLPLKPGTRFAYEGTSLTKGISTPHHIEYVVTDLTKPIDGVPSVVVWIVDLAAGKLVEKEVAFFAQSTDGTVWLMGEYPEEYQDGEFVANPSWIAGIQDARPGIAMEANPREGTPSYAQGWGPAVNWTDRAQVYKTGQQKVVPAGSYEDVLVMDEFNWKEPDIKLKYYARGVGEIGVGWRGDPFEKETLELVAHEQLGPEALAEVRAKALELEKSGYARSKEVYARTEPAVAPDGSSITPPTRSAEAEHGSSGGRTVRKIGDEEARKIALAAVPGEVTGLTIERKYGKQAIVVEVLAKDGSEVDVVMDMETGKVLGKE